jgi:hypothetical protein
MSADREDVDRIQEAAQQLNTLLKAATPTLNLLAMHKARFLCWQMRGFDSVIDREVTQIIDLLPYFFSLHRHERYPGGAEAIRLRITEDLLGTIRERASHDIQGSR